MNGISKSYCSSKKRTGKNGVRLVQDILTNGVIKQKSVGTFETKKEAIAEAYDHCDELHNLRSHELDETLITVGDFVEFYWIDQKE